MSADTFGKGPPIVATPNWIDPAEIVSYTGFASDDDALRLQTMQPSDRAQTLAVAGGASITYERAEAFPLNLAALLFGNMTGTASWRVRASGSLAGLDDPSDRLDTSDGFGAGIRFQGNGQTAAATDAAWNTATHFAISARVRPDPPVVLGEQGIFELAPAAGARAVLTLTTSRTLRFQRSTGGLDITGTTVLAYDRIYRVTISHDATSGLCAIFIDGVLEISAVLVGAFVTNPLTFTLAPSSPNTFCGFLDDVRLYDAARVAADEIADMVGEIDPADPDLLAYWKLNELQGSTGANEIGGGQPLTLTGSPLPYWSFPQRYWAAPDLESWKKTHSLFFMPVAESYVCSFAKVEMLDPNNTADFLYWGRLYLSAAFQFSKGINYGSSVLGWTNPSVRTRLPGGTGPVVRRAEPSPVRRIRFWSTDKEEVYYTVDNLARIRGGCRDALWVLEPYDDRWRHHQMVYGLDQADSEVAVPSYGLWEHSHTIEGLI